MKAKGKDNRDDEERNRMAGLVCTRTQTHEQHGTGVLVTPREAARGTSVEKECIENANPERSPTQQRVSKNVFSFPLGSF